MLYDFLRFCTNFPWGPPRKKVHLFCKMTKIRYNINIRTGVVFYKKCEKSQKTFSGKCNFFSTSGSVLRAPYRFGVLPLFIDDLTQQSIRKCISRCSKFSVGVPQGKSYFFRKFYINIKYQVK